MNEYKLEMRNLPFLNLKDGRLTEIQVEVQRNPLNRLWDVQGLVGMKEEWEKRSEKENLKYEKGRRI